MQVQTSAANCRFLKNRIKMILLCSNLSRFVIGEEFLVSRNQGAVKQNFREIIGNSVRNEVVGQGFMAINFRSSRTEVEVLIIQL